VTGEMLCALVRSFTSRLASASEHLVLYLDRADKQVVGTTYKSLHQLVDQVADSGFFDVASHSSAEPAEEAAVTEPTASSEAYEPAEMERVSGGNGMATLIGCCGFFSVIILMSAQ